MWFVYVNDVRNFAAENMMNIVRIQQVLWQENENIFLIFT